MPKCISIGRPFPFSMGPFEASTAESLTLTLARIHGHQPLVLVDNPSRGQKNIVFLSEETGSVVSSRIRPVILYTQALYVSYLWASFHPFSFPEAKNLYCQPPIPLLELCANSIALPTRISQIFRKISVSRKF